MKFALLITFLPLVTLAAPKKLLEVRFEKNKEVHLYNLVPTPKKPNQFTLSFKSNIRKPWSKNLTGRQAQYLQNEASQIIWKNEYRRPASLKNCTEYATLATSFERTRVCQQNLAVAGRTLGFLNELRSFQK